MASFTVSNPEYDSERIHQGLYRMARNSLIKEEKPFLKAKFKDILKVAADKLLDEEEAIGIPKVCAGKEPWAFGGKYADRRAVALIDKSLRVQMGTIRGSRFLQNLLTDCPIATVALMKG